MAVNRAGVLNEVHECGPLAFLAFLYLGMLRISYFAGGLTATTSMRAPFPANQLIPATTRAGAIRMAPSTNEKNNAGPKGSSPMRKRVSLLVRPDIRLIALSTQP